MLSCRDMSDLKGKLVDILTPHELFFVLYGQYVVEDRIGIIFKISKFTDTHLVLM